MNYASKHLTEFQFFLAEDFFRAFPNEERHDLLAIEDRLSFYSDCIFIVLESESTFAELGAFAIKNSLAKNILVINDRKFINDDSFISLGPLAKVGKISRFKPIIYTNLDAILKCIPDVQKRLSKIQRSNRKRFTVKSNKEFNELPGKVKMLLLLDLINIFHPISHKELIAVLEKLFGIDNYDIFFELGLLEALKLVFRVKSFYLRARGDTRYFFKFGNVNLIKYRSTIINHYHKYYWPKARILSAKFSEF